MAAIEPEFRLSVVIEFPERPGIRVVAMLALRAELLLMLIITCVAFVACDACIPEDC
jgi:hypothetical protein